MDIDDILAMNLVDEDSAIYEDDFIKVIKVFKEITTGSKDYVKRVQLVLWKNKKTAVPDLDIRSFNYKTGRYQKGITFNPLEVDELLEGIKNYQSHIKSNI